MRKITKAIIGLSAVGGTYALYRGGRNMIAEKCISESEVHGYVKPGFETVRDAFTENFRVRHELGAACSVYFRGERVVDLWGGVRDKATNDPWQRRHDDGRLLGHKRPGRNDSGPCPLERMVGL